MSDLSALTFELVSPLEGSAWTIELGAEPSLAALIEVRALGRGITGGREPFSMLFRVPEGPTGPQQIYRLHHAELGAFDLFLVPVGPAREGGMLYEAVMN